MKQLLITLLTLSLLLATGSCQRGKQTATGSSDSTSIADTTAADEAADSTLYGTGGEFGMSTFTLITDTHDTLNVARTANDGTDGAIYGDLLEGDRYAMTTRDNGEAIGVLINLTQLDRHLKGYEIHNGQVLVNDKLIKIRELSSKELKLDQ